MNPKKQIARAIMQWLMLEPFANMDMGPPRQDADGKFLLTTTYRSRGEARRAQIFLSVIQTTIGQRAVAWLWRAAELPLPPAPRNWRS
jgi:hypothetical protein